MSLHKNLDSLSESNYNSFLNSLDYKPLILFLGAGVNGGYTNSFSWNSLLEKILKFAMNNYEIQTNISHELRKDIEDIIKDSQDINTYHKASIIKTLLGDQYQSVIQNALYDIYYRDLAKNKIHEYRNGNISYMSAIADLCCRYSKCIAAVTYNYDDFLRATIEAGKEYYKENNRSNELTLFGAFNAINAGVKKDNADFPIYHVHGYIPPPDEIVSSKKSNIVLSYDEYFQNMLRPGSWQTTTQIHFLSNYTCLFLGASLNDWNMLRLISTAQEYTNETDIYTLSMGSPKNEENKNRHIEYLKRTTLEGIGVKTIYYDADKKYDYKSLYDFFKKYITQKLVNQE